MPVGFSQWHFPLLYKCCSFMNASWILSTCRICECKSCAFKQIKLKWLFCLTLAENSIVCKTIECRGFVFCLLYHSLVIHVICAHVCSSVTFFLSDQCSYNSFPCPPVGPGAASDGSGERRAAYHVVRTAHNGASHVGGSRSNHNAGPCIWSPGTAAGNG